MKLFMAYVGGYTQHANIELHDVRFVIGETIESCYPELLKQWWGDAKMFHLDAWGEVDSVDGFKVSLQDAPADHQEKLYFVNLGGYDSGEFTEQHKNILVVASDEKEAKAKAKLQIQAFEKPHKDRLFDVENMLALTQIEQKHVHLHYDGEQKAFDFICDYKVISS